MDKKDKIYIAGHRGLVGSALVRALKAEGYTNLVLKTREELDLTNQLKVNAFFSSEQPKYVFLAAAKVGGIYANNTYRGDFIYQNLAIQTNVIEAARQASVKRLLFLGSSCIYPRDSMQPMNENALLRGALESTNEPYAIAKIAGVKLCEAYNFQYKTDFAAVMPTNLYGPYDTFHLENSHVLPTLLMKAHHAKMRKEKGIVVWGTGKPLREFMHVDDMAAACLFIMKKVGYNEILNIGAGEEVSIKHLAEILCEIVGFNGEIEFDTSKPDGIPRKLVDTSKLNQLGWKPKINLRDGIKQTYSWCLENKIFDSIQ